MPSAVDHPHIRRRLNAWLKRGTLPHALLLVGQRGVGKMALGQWLAERIVKGNSEYVFTLAPLDHSIDAIRELRRRLHLVRSSVAPAVILIGGIEALGDEAAAALLKTLEEPRGETHFILTAHGTAADVLPTIRSRCGVVLISTIAYDALQQWLETEQGISSSAARWASRRSLGAPERAIALTRTAPRYRAHWHEALRQSLSERFAAVKTVADEEGWNEWIEEGLIALRDLLVFQEGCDDLVIESDVMPALEDEARRQASARLRSLLRRILTIERLMHETSVNRRLAMEEIMLEF